MIVTDMAVETLVPYARNPRNNTAAIDAVKASIAEFGFRQPIVVDEKLVVIVGHTRLEAAKQLGLKTVPVHVAALAVLTQIIVLPYHSIILLCSGWRGFPTASRNSSKPETPPTSSGGHRPSPLMKKG